MIKKKSILLCLVLTLFLLSFVSAYDSHKQDSQLNFSITSNFATECRLTSINKPLGIHFINQTGTQQYQTFNFSIDGGNYSEIGDYCHNIECTNATAIVTGEVCRYVNYFGQILTSSQSTLYIGLLAVLVFILFATFFGMGFLPNSNKKDEDGVILSVVYLKYLRLPLWLFAYFLFAGIIFLSSNLAYAFLGEQMFAKLLFGIYTILLSLSPVVVIVLVISFFVQFFHDRKFQKMLNRGMLPGGNL